jgi:hypothetical protein
MPPRLFPPPRWSRSFAAASAAVVLVFCGLASPQTPAPVQGPSQPMESAACVVRADTGAPVRADTVRIALVDSVNLAHAPFPANDGELLVSRQMYETLVRIDCEGQLAPGAAERWQSTDSGKVWTFGLRHGMRYWDGTPYPLSDFFKRQTKVEGYDSPVEQVEVVDDSTIRVVLAELATVPRRLTDLDVLIERPTAYLPPWSLPVGTGPYHLDTGSPHDLIRLVPVDSASHLPVLEFWPSTGRDPRDLLDRGADLMVTTDPALLEYARSRGDRVTVALPWTRTYSLVLALPVESLPPALTPLIDSTRAPEFRVALARDAVRAESRAASGGTRSGTELSNVPCIAPTKAAPRDRIVYLLGDRTAQDLAERLVALVPRKYRWRAAGLTEREFATALYCRRDVGAVASRPLSAAGFLVGPELPLVDTRAHAILRKGSPAWVVDGDGTLRMPLPGTIPP